MYVVPFDCTLQTIGEASMAEKTDRLIWLDALRLLAGISMVGLHASADSNGLPFPNAAEYQRVAPMILRAVLYVARTELFLIISIFLIVLAVDKRPRSYGSVLQQQCSRLLIPFFFWTVFYAFFGLYKASSFGYLESALINVSSPESWIGFLLLGDVKYHMHFIPTLFGVVLFFPLYRSVLKHPIMGLAILFLLLIKRELDQVAYAQLWGTDILPYAVRFLKTLAYTGYGLVAASFYTLWKSSRAQDRSAWLGLILLVGCLLFAVKLVAAFKIVQSGQWAFGYTPGYWADYLMPVLLFALCMCLGHRKWPDILSRLAPFSFGIYLCHPIFMDFAEINLRGVELTPIQLIGCKIAFVLPATSVFVWLLSKSRITAWTIGLGALPQLWPRRSRRPAGTLHSVTR